MPALLRPFVLVVQAVRAFFRADLRLRRGARGLEVVLDESRAAAPRLRRRGAARAEQDDARVQQELQAMQRALAALLDELPENRATLRHLAFIEYALAKKGAKALAKVPYDVLERALAQFEGVVTNWSDAGLAALRSKMAVMLIEREGQASQADGGTPQAQGGAPSSLLETDELAHPMLVADAEGQADADADAVAAEAALRAAYDEVMLLDLQLVPMDSAGEPGVEVQGELHSPSAKAIAKAARRGDEGAARTAAAELQG